MEGQQLPLESIAEETPPRVSWIESKSHMLDEVDQLMDLMSSEKDSLLSRVAHLEAELQEEREQRRVQMEQAQMEQAQWQSVKQQLKDEAGDEAHKWTKLIEAERASIRALKEQLCELEEQLVKKEKVIVELESFGQCQVKDLESKLKTAFMQHKRIKQNLEIQSSENMTLKAELIHAQEQQRTVQSEKKHLEAQLHECQQRCSLQNNEILALKGRLTNSRKSCDKLQARCSQLERESPKIVKVYTRRSDEDRLLMECKKKDELLASWVRETSNGRQEQSNLLEQLSNMEVKWKATEAENLRLQSELQSLQTKVKGHNQQICHYECKEKEYDQMKGEMERKLQCLDKELSAARSEVMGMQKALTALEHRYAEERSAHQLEQRGVQTLLKESKDVIKWLNSQLERERQEHTSAIELMAHQWQEEMKKAVDDYGRMKEAGARRCAQLAKDLWELKSKLDDT